MIVRCVCLALALIAFPVLAQDDNAPPADIGNSNDPQSQQAELSLRVGHLEDALRHAKGDIEELQNQNRKLEEDFKRFREDVEFRFSGNNKASALEPSPVRNTRHGDAFDPETSPNAPGAPHTLGETRASAPLTLSSHIYDDKPAPPAPPPPQEDQAQSPDFVPSGVPFSGSREQFKTALATYKSGDYDGAEAQFKAYIEANKGASDVAEALFYIGESYMQRARPREAAVQYIKISKDYPKSKIAPESMLRLGRALGQIGSKSEACATWAEVGRRYPKARPDVKKAAEREMTIHHCL